MASSVRPSPAHRARSRAACFLPQGFSLLELMIVLVIIAVTSAVALGRYWSSLGNYRADLAARRLAQDLQLAQTRARSTSAEQTVEFTPSASAYRLPGEKSLRPGEADMRVRLNDEPFNASILSLKSDAGSDTIRFDGYGLPDQTMRIRIGSGDHTRTVEVTAAGVISVATP